MATRSKWVITSALHLQLMSAGLAIGYPSVLALALTTNQTHIPATADEIDTIMGGYGILTAVSFIIFPTVMQLFGRKATNILINLCTLTGFICIAVATNVPTLIIGRFFQSYAFAGYYISSLIAAEYVHPKRRGFHIIIKGMFSVFGELLCHSLGLTILTYKQVAWMSTIPSILSILITMKWPESPPFLAYKGRYDECTKAFEWIRGTSSEARKELQELILFQEENRREADRTSIFVSTVEAFRKKDFLKPLLISVLLALAFQSTGLVSLNLYITEIINKIAGDRSKAFYYTIALDLMRMFSQVVSSGVVRLANRRVVLFSSSSLSCLLMTLLIVLYYLDKICVIRFQWLNPSILVLYYIVTSAFVVPIAMVSQGEMIPLKYKGIGGSFVGFVVALSSALLAQYSWRMILVLDIHGMFTVFLVCELVFLALLYVIMPETQDRTLQDIENDFVTKLYSKYDDKNLIDRQN